MIKTVRDNSLVVTVLTRSACSDCHAKQACSAADQKEKEINISCDSSGYVPGQIVNVTIEEAQGMKALLFGYVLPLFIMILMMVIVFTYTSDEVLAALTSLGILIPYYAGLFFFRDTFKRIFRFGIEKID